MLPEKNNLKVVYFWAKAWLDSAQVEYIYSLS